MANTAMKITMAGDATSLVAATKEAQTQLKEIAAQEKAASQAAKDQAAQAKALDAELSAQAKALGVTRDAFDQMTAAEKEAKARMVETSESFAATGESFDQLDTKAMGFRDGVTGAQDSMTSLSSFARGDFQNGLLFAGSGLSDLGSSMYNSVIPALEKTAVVMGITKAAAIGLAGGVIGAVALGTGLIVAATKADSLHVNMDYVNEDIQTFIKTGKETENMTGLSKSVDEWNRTLTDAQKSLFGVSNGLVDIQWDSIGAKNAFKDLDQYADAAFQSTGRLSDATDVLAAAGLTNEQIQLAESSGLLSKYAHDADITALSQKGLYIATDTLNDKFREALDSAKSYYDFVEAQSDPIFAAIQAQKDYADAQQAVIDAQKTYGKNSPQYQDAVLDAAQSNIALHDAVADASGVLTDDMINAMGLTKEQADALKGAMDNINASAQALNGQVFQFRIQALIDSNANINADLLQEDNTGAAMHMGGHIVLQYASGGVVGGKLGEPQLAIVHGGERVTPYGQSDHGDGETTNNYYRVINHVTVNGSDFKDGSVFEKWFENYTQKKMIRRGIAYPK